MGKKIVKKYAELMHQAQQATGRKEAVGLLHKAANLKNKSLDMTSKMHLARFPLAKTFLQSYQGVWRILQSVDSVWME